jgi:hypothetical protein
MPANHPRSKRDLDRLAFAQQQRRNPAIDVFEDRPIF